MGIYATLVRGRTYYLGSKLFERGKAVEVTEAERTTLEDEQVGAYDLITVEGRGELVPKFKFQEAEKAPTVEDKKPEGPRVRSRKPAQD